MSAGFGHENDVNSRYGKYGNIDESRLIWVTPRFLEELDIGWDMSIYTERDMDTEFPVYLSVLYEMIKETTIGETNGSEVTYPVEGSDLKVYVCVEIRGKLHKLQNEEWDRLGMVKYLPKEVQVKTFQRLIMEHQTTVDELAAEDIDNDVYKKLVVNEMDAPFLRQEKDKKIEDLYRKQISDPKYVEINKKSYGVDPVDIPEDDVNDEELASIISEAIKRRNQEKSKKNQK